MRDNAGGGFAVPLISQKHRLDSPSASAEKPDKVLSDLRCNMGPQSQFY